MSTENTEANVADKLAQALRDLMNVSYNYGVPHDIKERVAARAALAAHEAEKAKAVPVAAPMWQQIGADSPEQWERFKKWQRKEGGQG